VGGQDLQLPSPRKARRGNGIQAARIGVQGELVQNARPPLASLGVHAGGERAHGPAIGQPDAVCARPVGQTLAKVPRRHIQHPRPARAVLDEETPLNLVAAGHPYIMPRTGQTRRANGPVCRRPRHAHLPGLLHDLHARAVDDPPPLVRQEDPFARFGMLDDIHGQQMRIVDN
jgi:hypothetical protein